ncbi:MAG: hypothetical protein U0176_27125 [Bacteroidia bacterium]
MLLIEVGCMPYFSSFGTDFEHSLIAELTDLENKEKAEEYRPDFDHLLPDFVFFHLPDPLDINDQPWVSSFEDDLGTGPETDIFLLQRNFRL